MNRLAAFCLQDKGQVVSASLQAPELLLQLATASANSTRQQQSMIAPAELNRHAI
jgi:hypothetical protein